jgi:4-amino-4-deoxy-L-arabinose transferase-like glycosyltransferase
MGMDFEKTWIMDVRRKYVFAILAIGMLLFVFNLGGRDLWEPDETRYAVIAREMKETGNWILPHLNGEVYAEKPPLSFWLVNLSAFFVGENNALANRLPSALAGLIIVFVTFLLGERLFGLKAGFLSAMVLGTCILFPQVSRWVMLDSLFTLFFLLTLFSFYQGYEKAERRRKYYLLAGLFTGLAILTKGPAAYLALPIFLIFAGLQRNLKKFWCRDLLLGFLLSVVVVLIWWIPACRVGGKNYVHWLLFKQAVGTYVEGGRHFHEEPFYFYFIRFPAEFFPWIVFLPTAFVLGLRNKFGKRKEFLFLSIWFFFIFLFFTVSKGKKDNYLLPLYPAAALLVGALWGHGFQSGEGEKGFLPGLLVLTFLFFVGSVLFLLKIPQRFYPVLTDYSSVVVSVLFYLLVGSSLALLFFIKKKRLASFISLMIAFVLLHLHFGFFLPRFDPQKSARVFSERILRRMVPGDELKTYSLKSNGLLYYTKKPYIESIQSKERFFEILNSPQRVFVVIYPEALERLKKETGIALCPLERMVVANWKYVLISNR